MAKSTRGFCKYCGKEYTRTGIAKHLQTCKKRVDSCEKAEKTEKYFGILVFKAGIRIFFCTYIRKSVRFIIIHYLRKDYYHASDNRIHQQCR